MKLGLDPKFLDVHLVRKGSNIHEAEERELMLQKNPSFVIVLDQGSRGGPPVVDNTDVKSIVIDHHLSDEFPEGAEVRLSSVECQIYLLTGQGCFWMSLSTSCHDFSDHLRDMQRSRSRYCF